MIEAEQLSAQAHRDYGELVARVDVWPAGLGIDVRLIGGDLVQYLPDGSRYVVDQPSWRIRAHRAITALHGSIRRIARRGAGNIPAAS